MIGFLVKVRTATSSHHFGAICRSAGAAHAIASGHFDEACGITVTPATRQSMDLSNDEQELVLRTRAYAPDPFAGLRGRAYIAARKLDDRLAREKARLAARAANDESTACLIQWINAEPVAPRRTKCVLAFGSKENK